MKDYTLFFQEDWRVRKGLNINFGARWEYFSGPTDTQGRIGTYFTADMARQAGVQPGYHIPADSKIFQKDFDPIQIGLVLRPGTPWNLNQVNKAENSSTIYPDLNNVSPRIGFAWQPSFLPRTVIRGGYGIFYDRPRDRSSAICRFRHRSSFIRTSPLPPIWRIRTRASTSTLSRSP